MTDRTYTIQLTEIEQAQLEKLAAFEEREPADLLRGLVIGGLAAGHERRRVAEIARSGRSRTRK